MVTRTCCAAHQFVKVVDALGSVDDAVHVQERGARVHAR